MLFSSIEKAVRTYWLAIKKFKKILGDKVVSFNINLKAAKLDIKRPQRRNKIDIKQDVFMYVYMCL